MKSISYSVLDLASIKQDQSIHDTFQNSLRLAQHAESLGFTRFWMAEHHNLTSIASSATSVALGFIAGGTKTIRVGSGGVMLPQSRASCDRRTIWNLGESSIPIASIWEWAAPRVPIA